MDEIKLVPPIDVRRGDNGFVIIDANQTTHYFNRDGTYDGWSNDNDYNRCAAKIKADDGPRDR